MKISIWKLVKVGAATLAGVITLLAAFVIVLLYPGLLFANKVEY